MTVSWRRRLRNNERSRGVNSMMVVLLIAGIGVVLAGLLGIGFGIQIKEFSFGNTLIISGTVAACSGVIMLSLWAAVRELKSAGQRLGSGVATGAATPPAAGPGHQGPNEDEFQFGHDQQEPADAAAAQSPAAWQEEGAAPEPAEPPPPQKPRRNLLFSSSSRKERERAEARTIDPSTLDIPPAPVVPPPMPAPPPPVTFDDAWPQSERGRSADVAPQRRSGRTPSTFAETNTVATAAERYQPPPRPAEAPPVTVLKSGVVDGMAYSLYSDGSIEAQMPEGMMRFASIDELRSHLDQRQ
jgi:hypothetical protein